MFPYESASLVSPHDGDDLVFFSVPVNSIDASCSARLLEPFMRLASAESVAHDLVPQNFWSVHCDGRVSLREAHAMLDGGVERLHDDLLGLKLGSSMTFGPGGAFDYAVRSPPPLRESLVVASRYASLLTDSFHIAVEDRGDQTLVTLEDESSWPRSASDFAMSALYKIHLAESSRRSRVECWFQYSEPSDTTEYARTFPGATLRFGAPFYGFALDRGEAGAPSRSADLVLHAMLLGRVDALLSELRSARPLSAAVRRLIETEIPAGNPTADSVASTLHMSRRTMSRRLELERTTFQAELDAVRRRLALEHMRDPRLSLAEIAFLTGFSHVESFHRAFKRWTGRTPLAYRANGVPAQPHFAESAT